MSEPRRAQGKLTSHKLEGLGYKLVAVLAVLVVGHDCSRVYGVERVGVAAMAGGSRSGDEVKM
jgi:hypothetical protein